MNVIVVLVTFNRKKCLIKCLESLLSQTYKINKVLVIDNASTDGTDELFDSGDYSDIVEYHRLSVNTGGAGGFNFGLRRAKVLECDWVWIMDDDVMPEPNCLEMLLNDSIDSDIRQPVRLYADDEFVVSEAKVFNLSNPFFSLKRGLIKNRPKNSVKIQAFPFEGPLISRRVLTDLDEPLSHFFILADDTEYAIRAFKAGFVAYLISSAVMRRQIKPEKKIGFDWKFKYHLKNHIEIDFLHGGCLVKMVRPLLCVMYYVLSGVYHRRKFSDIVKPIKVAVCER